MPRVVPRLAVDRDHAALTQLELLGPVLTLPGCESTVMNPPELKLYPPRLLPPGIVWGAVTEAGFVAYVAANDDHAPFPVDPAAPPVLLLPAPKPRPKLTVV